jgi:DNA-directed RNA polymerase alpha subunit
VSRLLGGKAGESVEKFLADAIFVAVSAVDPRVEESPDEYSVQDSDQVATRYEPAELARMLGVAETVLSAKIDDLELGLRAANCLSRAGITTVGELVQHTECGLLRTSGGFGTSSLREIREVLARRGLRLGMVSSIERGSRT